MVLMLMVMGGILFIMLDDGGEYRMFGRDIDGEVGREPGLKRG